MPLGFKPQFRVRRAAALLVAQGALHQLHRPQRSGQALALGAELAEGGGGHVRRDQGAEFATGGPVSAPGAFERAIEDVSRVERQEDWMPPHSWVLAEFGQ